MIKINRIGELLTIFLWAMTSTIQANNKILTSPNQKIKITLSASNTGFTVSYWGKTAVICTRLGLMTKNKTGAVTCKKIILQQQKHIEEHYRMLSGKRSICNNEATEAVCTLSPQLKLRLRAYDNGIAFRYELSGLKADSIMGELTTYYIKQGLRRWMQNYQSSYEDFFPLTTAQPQEASSKRHWGYPALVELQDAQCYTLYSEADINPYQSASSLKSSGNTGYRVYPDRNPLLLEGNWHTPWRVVIIGKLSDVVESTLITDLASPSQLKDTTWIHPGVVSWVYWAYNHGSKDYQIVRKYIDMAARFHLPYVLIDAEWDEMTNGGNIEDAIHYAHQKGVRPLIWYNSSTAWINGAPGPKFRINTPEKREKEFTWLEKSGVAGVKVDFFDGDTQPTMAYCIAILKCAARHHLLVNFHGATIPRGWQRTFPNLLATEGVYGEEWYNNLPILTNKAACHNATLPFTRNVIGPMDYTPCAFSDSQHPHITSNAHELALTVLYQSGLQHLADKPESYYVQPSEVQHFLGKLPVAWDDTRLIAGYPGKYVIMARRKGATWYIAGINGTDKKLEVNLNFKSLRLSSAPLYLESFEDNASKEHPWEIKKGEKRLPDQVTMIPRGGFIFIIQVRKNKNL
jgi:hypothetical protein